MNEQVDLSEYTANWTDVSDQEKLPELVNTWTETFGQVSRYNEFPAILAFFTMLGQLTKDFVRIPYGYTIEDTRIHVCWIQTARSGKSVLNDFLNEIATLTWQQIQNRYDVDFNTFDCVDFTDSALVSSYVEVRNPDRGEEGEPDTIWNEVKGHIEGSGLLLFDEFESSGIFKKMSNKDSMVTFFQKMMNTLTTDGYLIRRVLTGKPIATTRCDRSVWATSYFPEHLTETIADKGVLQRMFLYVNDVPQEVLNKMRSELISAIGTIKRRTTPKNRFSQAFVTLYECAKERHDMLALDFDDRMANLPEDERFNCPQEEMMIWGDGVQELVQLEYDNMVAFLTKVPDEVRKIVSLFETNSLIYITKFAVLCAITETPGRKDSEKWVVTARNVKQSSAIVRQGYMSLVAWLLTALKVKRQTVAETAGMNDYINCFYNISPDKKEDGWVTKSVLRIELEERYNIPHAKFYRTWPKISHKFDTKKHCKTVLVKVKEDE